MPNGLRRFACSVEFEDWLANVARDRFSRQQSFEAGNWAALYDATVQALLDGKRAQPQPKAEDQVLVPRWVLEALLVQVLKSFIPSAPGKGRGRHARWREQYRQDLIDWRRFIEVWYRKLASSPYDRTMPSRGEAKRRRQAQARFAAARRCDDARIDFDTWYPWTTSRGADDLSVFQAAAHVLRGSIYGGSPSAIRDSHDRVLKALRRGDAARYYPTKWMRGFGHAHVLAADRAR